LRAGSDAEPPELQDEDELDLDSLSIEDLRSPGAVRRRQTTRSARGAGAGTRSPVLPVLIAAVALLCVAGVIFVGYSWFFGGSKDGRVPVVRAADDPVKVKPASPGGLEVPYQDRLVLNQEESVSETEPVVERLLPPPETPQPPRSELEPTDLAAAVAGPAQNAGIVEAPVPEAGTLFEVPPPEGTSQPSELRPAETAPEIPQAPAASAQTAEESDRAAPAPPATQIVQEAAKAPAKGSYLVQLGSFTSTKGTERAWAKLQKAHPDLLGDMSLFVEEATVNDRNYFRVQAGPLPNLATALDMCAQL
jgi:cell division septation protein DedD